MKACDKDSKGGCNAFQASRCSGPGMLEGCPLRYLGRVLVVSQGSAQLPFSQGHVSITIPRQNDVLPPMHSYTYLSSVNLSSCIHIVLKNTHFKK